MRIYSNARQLMSEMGRDLWEMGTEVRPKTYQNKVIEGNDNFITKELMCKQYCLTGLPDPEYLFVYTRTQEWANAEFKERISGKSVNPGEAWKLNKGMWEQFLVFGNYIGTNHKFDYTYSERINRHTQNKKFNEMVCSTYLKDIILLLKHDPDTRKAVLSIFNPSMDADNLDGTCRIPCSMYYDFLIRDGKLNITYHQRSSDFVQHFGDDVYLAYRLMQYVAEQVGVKPGNLIHTIDSLHSYKKDWILLKTSIDDLVDIK